MFGVIVAIWSIFWLVWLVRMWNHSVRVERILTVLIDRLDLKRVERTIGELLEAQCKTKALLEGIDHQISSINLEVGRIERRSSEGRR